MKIKLKHIAIAISVIILDLAVYIFLGLLLMGYEDFYTESEGEYWSLESMTLSEKVTYIGLNVWNVLNLIVFTYLVYRIIKNIKKGGNKL